MPTSQLIDQKYDNALLVGIRSWGYPCGTGTFSKNSVIPGLHLSEIDYSTLHLTGLNIIKLSWIEVDYKTHQKHGIC